MRIPLVVSALMLLLAAPIWGLNLDGSCEVNFLGTSTLHDFSGIGPCDSFRIILDDALTRAELTDGEGIRVPVSKMDTDNRKRDVKMREMFDSGRFPFVRGSLQPFDPRRLVEKLFGASGEGDPLVFDLTIRDITHPVEGHVVNFREDGESISFELDFDVSLDAYRLKPPSVLGFIRVGDTVSVRVPFRLVKSERGIWLSKH